MTTYNQRYFSPTTQKPKEVLNRYITLLEDKVKLRNKMICDLGCGEGCLLELLNKNFSIPKSRLWGIDISDYAILTIKKKGFKGKVCDLSQEIRNGKRKYDLIFALDVIEHLRNPYMFLENLKTMLRRSGFVVITTPNIFSLSHLLQRKKWYGYLDKSHMILFNDDNLSYIFNKVGFKVTESKTISNTNNFIYNTLTELFGIASQLFYLLKLK